MLYNYIYERYIAKQVKENKGALNKKEVISLDKQELLYTIKLFLKAFKGATKFL